MRKVYKNSQQENVHQKSSRVFGTGKAQVSKKHTFSKELLKYYANAIHAAKMTPMWR